MLIAITGLNGSGKDTVADYIKEKYGYKHISLSSLVNKLTIEQGKDIRKRDDLNFVADSQRKKDGSAFLAKQALKDYKKNDHLVLSSFRHPSEIELVREKEGIIIRIDSPLKTRFERNVLRKKKNPGTDHGSVNLDDFIKKQNRELSNPDKDKMQISEVLKHTDFIIKNDSTLISLHKKIDILIDIISVGD